MMGGESVIMYYTLNFHLADHGIANISEVEDMFPFERDVYVYQLINKLKKENEKKRQING